MLNQLLTAWRARRVLIVGRADRISLFAQAFLAELGARPARIAPGQDAETLCRALSEGRVSAILVPCLRALAPEDDLLAQLHALLTLLGEAREAGAFLAAIAREHAGRGERLAFIAGGETVVHVRGTGLGGRSQELALAAAKGIDGLEGALVFSVGSDGTDGPTDAAGGMVTGRTCGLLRAAGADIEAALDGNDAYHALEKCGGLIFTGPTGTNVNDLSVVLVEG